MSGLKQITNKETLSKLLWKDTNTCIPIATEVQKEYGLGQITYTQLLLEMCTTYSIPWNDMGYYWEHYGLENEQQRDVLLLTDKEESWCMGCIFADRKYKETDKNNVVLYTNHDVHSIAEGVKIALLATLNSKGPVFSVNRQSVVLPEITLKHIMRAAIDTLNLKKIVYNEVTRICSEKTRCWPVPRILLNIICRSMTKDSWFVSYPQPKETRWLSCDVVTVLKYFPFMISRRLGTLTRGIFVIEERVILKANVFTEWIKVYITNICTDSRLANFIENSTLQNDTGTFEYIDRLKRSTSKSRVSKRRLSTSKNSDAPPCIHSLYKTTSPWNNEIRFQLAIVIKTVANDWGIDADTLASTCIVFMQQSGMTDRRVRHLQAHLKRQSAPDSRLCVTRRHKLNSVKTEIHCYYGGGTLGVERCIASRKFPSKAITAENATISNIWAYSKALTITPTTITLPETITE